MEVTKDIYKWLSKEKIINVSQDFLKSNNQATQKMDGENLSSFISGCLFVPIINKLIQQKVYFI